MTLGNKSLCFETLKVTDIDRLGWECFVAPAPLCRCSLTRFMTFHETRVRARNEPKTHYELNEQLTSVFIFAARIDKALLCDFVCRDIVKIQ